MTPSDVSPAEHERDHLLAAIPSLGDAQAVVSGLRDAGLGAKTATMYAWIATVRDARQLPAG